MAHVAHGGAVRPISVPVRHLYWANTNSNTIGRANLHGTGANQSFISVSQSQGLALETG